MAGIRPESVIDNHLRKESGNSRTFGYCRANSATGPGSHLPSRIQPRKEVPDDAVDNGLDNLDYFDEILGSISSLQEDISHLSEMSQSMFQRLLDLQGAHRQGPRGRKRRARSYSPYPSPPGQRQPVRRMAYQRMPSSRMGVRSIQPGFRAAQYQSKPEIEDDEGDMEDEEEYHRGRGMARSMYMASQAMKMSYADEADGSEFGQVYQGHVDPPSFAQGVHQDGMYPFHRQQQPFHGASSDLGQPQVLNQRQAPTDTIASHHTPHAAMGGFMLPPRSPSAQKAHRQFARQPVAAMAPDMPPPSNTLTLRTGSSLFTGGPAPGVTSYHEPQNHRHQQQLYHQRQPNLDQEHADSITVDTFASLAKAVDREQETQSNRSSPAQA